MPLPLPSSLTQPTTNAPPEAIATVEFAWSPVVVVLTRNSPPCAVPSAAKRRA